MNNESINLESLRSKKTALVLSGGIVKAASWHLGVSLALEELGFNFTQAENKTSPSSLDISTYVGSSAGGMIATYLASGYSPQDIIYSLLGSDNQVKSFGYKDMLYFRRPDLKSLKTNLFDPFANFPLPIRKLLQPLHSFSGLFSTEGIKKYLVKNVLKDDSFESLAVDLFIVATQLDNSKKVIFGKYNYPNPSHDSTATYQKGVKISDAAAATMSVPPFYSPYPIKNDLSNQIDYYIDGEIRETLSTHVAFDNNCEVIISSWTHTPYHYHDEIGSLYHYGIPTIITQSLYLMIQKKIVSHRAQIATTNDLINTIHSYMKQEKFSKKHTNDIMKILESKLSHRPNVKLIDISPDPDDYEVFFFNPFSLDKNLTAKIVRKGYKKTLQVFNQHFGSK